MAIAPYFYRMWLHLILIFKISTNFWKIKYTNFFMWMQDVRPELTVDSAYKQKYKAMHYLDWNVTKKFNLVLFVAVVWDMSLIII